MPLPLPLATIWNSAIAWSSPGRKDLNLLHPPALPALAPPRDPLEEAVMAAVIIGIENVRVLDLDLGIKPGDGRVQVRLFDSGQQAAHYLHALLRHRPMSIPRATPVRGQPRFPRNFAGIAVPATCDGKRPVILKGPRR